MLAREKQSGDLLTGSAASGIEAAPARFGLLCGTAGTFDGHVKGKAQVQNTRPKVPTGRQGAERLVVCAGQRTVQAG